MNVFRATLVTPLVLDADHCAFLTVNASQIKLALIKNVLLPVNRVTSVEAMLDVQSLTTSPSVTANQTTLETLSKLALKYVCDIFTQFA